MIPISKPFMGDEEKRAAISVLESGVLAQGTRVAEFERAFAEFVGVRHAVATCNGTMALYVALLAHGIGPGDEVITTPFTFIASINSIVYTGARPVLVDVDETFNIDSTQLEGAVTPRTRAVMPVHLYGQPSDMQGIVNFARDHNLVLVEDACQAHGASFDGRPVGSFGTGCFSFYATKNMTTGEGGMLTANDDAVAERARLLINHGMQLRYHHEIRGYNFRMTDLAAAIGIEQLKKLADLNMKREQNAKFFTNCLSGISGLVTPAIAQRRTHVWHQYTLRVTPNFPVSRDQLAEKLSRFGIGTGIYYPIPAHRQESLRDVIGDDLGFARSEQFSREVISIPVHPGISEADRDHIVRTLQGIAESSAL